MTIGDEEAMRQAKLVYAELVERGCNENDVCRVSAALDRVCRLRNPSYFVDDELDEGEEHET